MELEVIIETHQLKNQGVKISQIMRKETERTTVYEYLKTDCEKACKWVEELKARKRKLNLYRGYILSWPKEHPNLPAFQISDWLKNALF